MYFESHAHYDDKRFREDREKLLELLPSCGIDHVVNIGCDLKSSKESIRLAEKYDYIYASVGVHPHEVSEMTSQTIEELRRLAAHEKVVAIGEIGLDYYYDFSPRELQQFWFRQQLRLAESVNKPVIIHSRDASQELVQKVLDDTTADENTKTEAANQAAEISQNIVTETNIENLVKSKGFVDCVAFIQNGACNVVVQKDGEFASADAIAIKDIVVAQAKISADKITIVSK